MPLSTTKEPVVRHSNPMPPGYVFVPKGNVYLTGNCRRQTQASNQIVYAVVSQDKKTLGIRVPIAIYNKVRASEASTREDRAAAVQKRDLAEERVFRDAILKLFPNIPADTIPKIVARAMQKRSGRVGRSGKLDVEVKATLAVQAHVRHVHTEYDTMLRKGAKREQARDKSLDKINEVLMAWGGRGVENRRRKRRTKQGRNRNAAIKTESTTITVKTEKTATKKARHSQMSRNDISTGKPNADNSRRTRQYPRERRFRKLKARLPRSDKITPNRTDPSCSRMGKSLRDMSDTDDESDEFDGSESDDFESPETVIYEDSEGDEYGGSETDDDYID